MKTIEPWQRRALYGIGSSVGIVSRGSDDNLHQLINSLTGKEHISELTFDEANVVINDLKERMRGNFKEQPVERKAGAMTEGQRKKVWQLMYLLQKKDAAVSSASLGNRLCGIIKRQFQLSASEKDPFRWLSYKQGAQLIEIIKQYIRSASAKSEGRAASG